MQDEIQLRSYLVLQVKHSSFLTDCNQNYVS